MGRKNENEEQNGGICLEDFIVPEKINAFISYYKPAQDESSCDEVFSDAKLRQFFKAWPCSLGDPLSVYASKLETEGFNMGVSFSGEPAYFVCLREKGGKE